MTELSRARFRRLVRQRDCDLAEAALLVCAEFQPEVDVDAELLRLDAIADALRSHGFISSTPESDAEALAAWLGEELGFGEPEGDYYDPRNALLTDVLDTKEGLPITLSIVYIAVAQRLRIPAHGIGLPGHFVTGIGRGPDPVVIDPFHGGRTLDEDDLIELVHEATGGQSSYTPGMLRATPPPDVMRRLLHNLTRDLANQGDLQSATLAHELLLLLPSAPAADLRRYGELLARVGRYDEAARRLDDYVKVADDAELRAEARRMAQRARAKLN